MTKKEEYKRLWREISLALLIPIVLIADSESFSNSLFVHFSLFLLWLITIINLFILIELNLDEKVIKKQIASTDQDGFWAIFVNQKHSLKLIVLLITTFSFSTQVPIDFIWLLLFYYWSSMFLLRSSSHKTLSAFISFITPLNISNTLWSMTDKGHFNKENLPKNMKNRIPTIFLLLTYFILFLTLKNWLLETFNQIKDVLFCIISK